VYLPSVSFKNAMTKKTFAVPKKRNIIRQQLSLMRIANPNLRKYLAAG